MAAVPRLRPFLFNSWAPSLIHIPKSVAWHLYTASLHGCGACRDAKLQRVFENVQRPAQRFTSSGYVQTSTNPYKKLEVWGDGWEHMHIYIYIYIVLVLLMICNRFGITSAGRLDLVKAFVEDSWRFRGRFRGNPCGNPFCHTFCHKKWSWEFRWNFVKDFVTSTQVWRNLNELFDEILTSFFCGKMLWQNVLPQHFATKKNRQNFVKDFVASIQVLTKS